MTEFFERIGAPLVSPREGMRRAADRRAGRGAADVGFLLLVTWAAAQVPALVHAFFRGRELGVGAGLRGLVEVLSALMPMIFGVMLGALVLSVLAGRPPARREGEEPRADAVDLAAYSIVPFILVQNLAMFYFIARETPPSPTTFQLVVGVGLLWSLVAWCFALIALKDRRRRDA